MHTFIAGAGFSGSVIAQRALTLGAVSATRRQIDKLQQLSHLGVHAMLMNESLDDALKAALATTTHLVVCVAPARTAPLFDPVMNLFTTSDSSVRQLLPNIEWIGYLSTIGVYGDHDGAWVDETTPCTSVQMRSIMRLEAEKLWQSLALQLDVPMAVLRLSGIYGPGRNAVQDALDGRARMLIKPRQVFNRVHVADLATAALLAAQQGYNGVLNITDNLPAPPQDVIRFAHDLVSRAHPEAVDYSTADISDMARSFYSENKRVGNERSKLKLGLSYLYPDYKAGLRACVHT